jgi:hypothetical protein
MALPTGWGIHKIVNEPTILGSRGSHGQILVTGEDTTLRVLPGGVTRDHEPVIEGPGLRPPGRGRQRLPDQHDHEDSEEPTHGAHEPTQLKPAAL